MGTTDTALRAQYGVQVGFSLVIEGFTYVICDAGDVDPVVTAYAGTAWSQALSGLRVVGGVKQSLEPFKPDLDVPVLTFQVLADPDDTFGIAVWKNRPSITSRLDALFTAAADGSGTLTVKNNDAFPASGAIYLGTRRVSYSAKPNSTTFTIPAAGAATFQPFAADGSNTYSRPQSFEGAGTHDAAAPPRVSDVPPTWIGKQVALRIHRIVGGVWDTVAQAHLEFAGTIQSIEDGDGITSVTCIDMRKRIEDAVLLREQWVAKVAPGIFLKAGDKLMAVEVISEAGGVFSTSRTVSSVFTVVASGASSDNEVDEGLYEFDDFLRRLSTWLGSDATLTAEWTAYRKTRPEGMRTVFRANFGGGGTRHIQLWSTSSYILEFMGFDIQQTSPEDGGWLKVSNADKVDPLFITSSAAPFRVRAIHRPIAGQTGYSIYLDVHEGTWVDHAEFLHDGFGFTSADDWSYVLVGGQLVVAERSSDTLLVNVSPVSGPGGLVRGASDGVRPPRESLNPGLTFDDDGEDLDVQQVVFLAGKVSEILPRLLASVAGDGVNHATYDALPFGAAIPWNLLGTTFVNSCASLETADGTDTISVLLTKPTRLKDILIPELALRFAFLVFKDGVYQLVSPPVPNALTATHTLTEANKAYGVNDEPPPTSAEVTSEWLTNVIKISHGRNTAGDFVGQPLVFRDTVSIDTYGETKPIEIDAVNTVAENSKLSGSNIESLAANLVTRLLPTFGKPVKVIRRTIAPTLYHMAPGDTVALSDDLVRDPTSGRRGLTSRACICLSVFHDYAHEGGDGAIMRGEVTLLMSDEDRTYPLSPAAEVDTTVSTGGYTDGYDAVLFRLKLKSHAFSKSTDALDVTNFDHGDLVRILELDPADPTAPDAWDRTLHASAGVGSDYIQLTASLSSPAYAGSTKKYVVIPQRFASVQASQKLHAFQADDADGMIQDAAEENSYGTADELSFNRGVATDLPALLATELYGDGRPITPFHLQYLVRAANNLTSYKTATHAPYLMTDIPATTSTSFVVLLFLPLYLGGYQVQGRNRYLSIAPMFRSTAGHTVTVRVTTSRFPPSGTSLTAYSFNSTTTRSVDFTTTSTTHAVAAAQDLLPIPAQLPGCTWLTVQLKTANAASECRLYGFPTLRLKHIV